MDSVWSFLSQRPTGPIYHYTDATGLLGILGNKEIWATDALHLNDAREFKCSMELLQAELEKRSNSEFALAGRSSEWNSLLAEWKEDPQGRHQSRMYVASFSARGNQLSQWRSYCRNGNGFSIGFHPSDLAYAQRTSSFHLVKCVYHANEQASLIRSVVSYLEKGWLKARRIEGLDGLAFLLRLGSKATAAMLAIKDSSFEEEQEWRLVGYANAHIPLRFRAGRYGIVSYCALPLSRPNEKPTVADIYLGPNDNVEEAMIAVSDFLRHATSQNPGHTDNVVPSGIPYRY
jgi:Protein of unknown function (DUF2971)